MSITRKRKSVICHLSSVIWRDRYPSASGLRKRKSVICHLSSVIWRDRYPSASGLRKRKSVICHLSSVICHLARQIPHKWSGVTKYESSEFPQVERAFEGLEPQIRETEKPKSTESKVRENPKKFTGSDILQIYEAQATIVKTDLETGRIADFSDAVEELETRLLTSGISKDRVKDFVRIFKHRLSAERLSN